MEKVLPVIIICGIGIAAAFAYIVFVAVQAVCRKRKQYGNKVSSRNEFEIEEDVLVVKLGKSRKSKRH